MTSWACIDITCTCKHLSHFDQKVLKSNPVYLVISVRLILFLSSTNLNCRSLLSAAAVYPRSYMRTCQTLCCTALDKRTFHTKHHHRSSGPIWLVWTVYLKALCYYYNNVCSPPRHQCNPVVWWRLWTHTPLRFCSALWEMWQRLDQTISYLVFRLPPRLKEKSSWRPWKQCVYKNKQVIYDNWYSTVCFSSSHTQDKPNLYEHKIYFKSQWGPNNHKRKCSGLEWHELSI